MSEDYRTDLRGGGGDTEERESAPLLVNVSTVIIEFSSYIYTCILTDSQ